MGKRSRKRTGSESALPSGKDAAADGGSTRAERDAARSQRAASARAGKASTATGSPPAARKSAPRRGERPPPPWGSFPLVELCVLIAIVLLVAGFFTGGTRGATMIFAGLALGSLSGLELSVREHFAGFRSHTTILSGGAALLAGTLLAVLVGEIWLPLLVGVALAVFLACFFLFRRVFKKRSGGLAFR